MNAAARLATCLVIFLIAFGYGSAYAAENENLQELERGYNEGVELMEAGDYEAAREAFRDVVNSPVKDLDRESKVRASSWNNLGSMALEQGNLEEAERAFKKSVELNPEHAGTHNNIGGLRLRQGRYEDAVEAYDTAIRLNPKDVEPINNLANLLVTVRQYERAHKLIVSALKMEIANERSLKLMARMYAETDTEEGVKDILKLWLREAGPEPEDMAKVGLQYLSFGQPELARIVLNTVREQNPEWEGGEGLKGRILAAEGKWDKSVQKLRAVLEESPEDAAVRNDLVTVLLRSGKTDEALKVAEEGTRLDSQEVQAVSWYLKGLVHEEQGDSSAAASAYREVIEISPEHPRALMNLANLEADKGNAEKAVELLEKALNSDPYNRNIRYNLGRILTISQIDYKRGVRMLQQAAKGQGEAAQKARDLINRMYEGVRKQEREKSGLTIQDSALAKRGAETWKRAKDGTFQKGDMVGLVLLNVSGFEKGDDGLNRMDLDIEVKGPDGEIISAKSDILGEEGHANLENNTAESPIGTFNTTPELESGEYTIELTVKDKVGKSRASRRKTFTLE